MQNCSAAPGADRHDAAVPCQRPATPSSRIISRVDWKRPLYLPPRMRGEGDEGERGGGEQGSRGRPLGVMVVVAAAAAAAAVAVGEAAEEAALPAAAAAPTATPSTPDAAIMRSRTIQMGLVIMQVLVHDAAAATPLMSTSGERRTIPPSAESPPGGGGVCPSSRGNAASRTRHQLYVVKNRDSDGARPRMDGLTPFISPRMPSSAATVRSVCTTPRYLSATPGVDR